MGRERVLTRQLYYIRTVSITVHLFLNDFNREDLSDKLLIWRDIATNAETGVHACHTTQLADCATSISGEFVNLFPSRCFGRVWLRRSGYCQGGLGNLQGNS